jgi:hypothetical protein
VDDTTLYWLLAPPAAVGLFFLARAPRAHRCARLSHGVRELWTGHRDFSRFRALKVRNPLVGWRGDSHL